MDCRRKRDAALRSGLMPGGYWPRFRSVGLSTAHCGTLFQYPSQKRARVFCSHMKRAKNFSLAQPAMVSAYCCQRSGCGAAAAATAAAFAVGALPGAPVPALGGLSDPATAGSAPALGEAFAPALRAAPGSCPGSPATAGVPCSAADGDPAAGAAGAPGSAAVADDFGDSCPAGAAAGGASAAGGAAASFAGSLGTVGGGASLFGASAATAVFFASPPPPNMR